MKVGHPPMLRVLVIALIFSAVMVLGQTKRADAYTYFGGGGGREVFLAVLVMAAATYTMVMGPACAPIAAVKGKDYPGGFSAAYVDCFSLEMKKTPLTEEDNGASKQAAEEEDEGQIVDLSAPLP